MTTPPAMPPPTVPPPPAPTTAPSGRPAFVPQPMPTMATSAATRLVGLALAGGLLLELAVRGEPANALLTLGLLAAAAIVISRDDTTAGARHLALLSGIPAILLSLRASPTLTLLAGAAAASLLGAAVLWSASGTLLDTSIGPVVVRTMKATRRGFGHLGALGRALPSPPGEQAASLARALGAVLLTLPLLIGLVALLAASDAVFAGLVTTDLDLAGLAGHAVLLILFASGLILLGLGMGVEDEDRPVAGPFGTTEIVTVLGATAAVLGLFVASQLVALTDAGRRLVEEAGLTPAEYARSGFFQLCWASLVVIAIGAMARAMATPDTRATRTVRAVSAAVPLLAVGLVLVSLQRMSLYDQTFGLTMLRLVVVAASLWIGVLQIMIATRNAGLGRDRDWVLGGALFAALAVVVGLYAINAEGFIVRHNLARADDSAEVDTTYLGRLSDDAAPALAEALDGTDDPEQRRALLVALCQTVPAEGVGRLNLAVARAEAARGATCPDATDDPTP